MGHEAQSTMKKGPVGKPDLYFRKIVIMDQNLTFTPVEIAATRSLPKS